MDESEVGEKVSGCALKVHKALGPGLPESAYEACIAHALHAAGLEFKRQLTLPIVYDGMTIDAGYRLDLLVADLVVVEVKAVESLKDIH
jgi:GxxExxY protein